jgi:hypothetical protein
MHLEQHADKVPQSVLPATVVVYVRRGSVQWAASNDASATIVILEADLLAKERPVNCWRAGLISLDQVKPDLMKLVSATLGPHTGLPTATEEVRHSLACPCVRPIGW